MVPDFSGYATRSGIKCSDGRTITPQAFKHMDGMTVPLVWQHQSNSPENVLGHAVLHHRDDGIWADGYFNDTANGQNAKKLIKHGDIKALSIYANHLVEKAKNVLHGMIREVSLVMAGANPGAYIDPVTIAHGDGFEVLEDEAVIYSGEELTHASVPVKQPSKVPMKPPAPPAPSGSDTDADDDGDDDAPLPEDATVQDVIDSMTEQQRNVMFGLLGEAVSQQDPVGTNPIAHDKKDEGPVRRNVFDQTKTDDKPGNSPALPGGTLSHADTASIFSDAKKCGSLRQAAESYALTHGIDDIATLFPYDQAVTDTPEFISRRMEWVAGVLNGVKKTPFSRIRSWTADLRFEDARAKGYVTGALKKEEYIQVAKRITTPQTVYKKQKLDRDDIVDITEFDVVAWLQTEMRLMLDEEIARAILIGDGRESDDPDKINPVNIRPIYGDDALYVSNHYVDLSASGSTPDDIVDAVVTGMTYYRGSGNPIFFTTLQYLAKILLTKDSLGRRLYNNKQDVATAMGVSDIIAVEAMSSIPNVVGVIVNLVDYTMGADKMGVVSMFDFFDIDYNQQKYLLETRCSGAMTKFKGAVVVQDFSGAGGLLPNPTSPTFVSSTGVVTIPTTANVTYVTVDDTTGTESSTLTAGAQTAIASGTTVHVRAKAAATYSFVDNENSDWYFTAQ